MLLEVNDWLPPLSKPVREERDIPPLCWLPFWLLSWFAALERESCQEVAWAPKVNKAPATIAVRNNVFADFIDVLFAVAEHAKIITLAVFRNILILFSGYAIAVAFPVKIDPQAIAQPHTVHYALAK